MDGGNEREDVDEGGGTARIFTLQFAPSGRICGYSDGPPADKPEPAPPTAVTVKVETWPELLELANESGQTLEAFILWIIDCGVSRYQEVLEDERDPPLLPPWEKEVELPF